MLQFMCYFLILSGCLHRMALCEVFTAMTEMENLLDHEQRMVLTLEEYMRAEESRLLEIKKFIKSFNELYASAEGNMETFVSHPVNSFLLMKLLITDFKDLEDLMNQSVLGREYLQRIFEMRKSVNFPTDEDLTGSAVALCRLMDTYRLDADLIAKGKIKGVANSPLLSPSDCFELGKVLYNFKDYDHSIKWMKAALNRLEDSWTANETVTKSSVLEYLAFSSYMKGDVHGALRFTNDLLDHEPTHERAQNNIGYYEKEIQAHNQGRKHGDDGDTVVSHKGYVEIKPNRWVDERRSYEILCRGEKSVSPNMERRLKCFYSAGHPYLRIQPVKTEVFHLDPDVFLFYDVISDSEIAVIKSLAAPKLQRATVQNSVTGELETAHYRISKSAWLNEDVSPVIRRLNRRISHLTGLDTNFAEELQIANYGIGGHYEPHFDFARKVERKAFTSLGMGNRLATFLFYMSDVEAGGATVFTRLNLTLWPVKGAAAFWHNLYKNGEGDLRTRHAACPVLSGVKWVSNKWIHEYGQETNRPCGIAPDGFESEEAE